MRRGDGRQERDLRGALRADWIPTFAFAEAPWSSGPPRFRDLGRYGKHLGRSARCAGSRARASRDHRGRRWRCDWRRRPGRARAGLQVAGRTVNGVPSRVRWRRPVTVSYGALKGTSVNGVPLTIA
jgi:hypothetical protein